MTTKIKPTSDELAKKAAALEAEARAARVAANALHDQELAQAHAEDQKRARLSIEERWQGAQAKVEEAAQAREAAVAACDVAIDELMSCFDAVKEASAALAEAHRKATGRTIMSTHPKEIEREFGRAFASSIFHRVNRGGLGDVRIPSSVSGPFQPWAGHRLNLERAILADMEAFDPFAHRGLYPKPELDGAA